jgi:hypothetical protein
VLRLCSYNTIIQWHTKGRGSVWGVKPPLKFQSFDKAELISQSCGKYIRNNLIRIQVSLICKFAEALTRGLLHPDPCSLCPLYSTEFVEPPLNKIPGYATAIIIYHYFTFIVDRSLGNKVKNYQYDISKVNLHILL